MAQQAASHDSIFVSDPNCSSSFKLAPSPSLAGVRTSGSCCLVLEWAPEMDLGSCCPPWIGWLELFQSVLRWPVRLCFFPAHVFGTRYILFREYVREEEKWGRWKASGRSGRWRISFVLVPLPESNTGISGICVCRWMIWQHVSTRDKDRASKNMIRDSFSRILSKRSIWCSLKGRFTSKSHLLIFHWPVVLSVFLDLF